MARSSDWIQRHNSNLLVDEISIGYLGRIWTIKFIFSGNIVWDTMSRDDNEHGVIEGSITWGRRGFLKLNTALATAAGLIGVSGTAAGETGSDVGTADGDSGEHGETPTTERIDTSRRVTPRDFGNHNYERTYSARKRKALEILLRDQKANKLARRWIGSFEAYEPLTNHLDMVSVQGPRDLDISGTFEDGEFTVTATSRQVVYGLIDRYTEEILAMEISEPHDVTWVESYTDAQLERGQVVLDQPEVQTYLRDKDWYPLAKVGEIITAFEDFAHGEVTIVIFVAKDPGNSPSDPGGNLSVVSAYVDVTGTDPEFLHAHIVDDFVEFPPQKIAREITPRSNSVLHDVPDVPFEKRPFFTADHGHHRHDTPATSVSQDGWEIGWEGPVTQGVTMAADFNGKPVFEAMNSPVTFTGYDLPPRQGKNTREWFFPDDSPVFVGHHLFWDIHSLTFGGPGILGKIDYPAQNGHPEGFRLKTHFHTGAQGRESSDFHSGVRFGPYNYDISYEFFADGAIRPIWRRHGPGYAVESLRNYGLPEYGAGEEGEMIHYISAQAMNVTPGTRDGVHVEFFDGDQWTTPTEEFYVRGAPGTIARFSNPDGPETIELPLDRDTELVVVRPSPDEIGVGTGTATRVLDTDAELAFYHPAQYVDGQPIQGERLVVWILMDAAVDQMPHPSGITSFATMSEVNLRGYGSA